MEIEKMIAELRQERDHIEQVISSLELLALGGRKRRGRPPAWLKEAAAAPAKRRGRPPGSKNKAKAGMPYAAGSAG
jgi:hypothetical protein